MGAGQMSTMRSEEGMGGGWPNGCLTDYVIVGLNLVSKGVCRMHEDMVYLVYSRSYEPSWPIENNTVIRETVATLIK